MTASRQGLAILTAIALALGLWTALDRPRAATVASHRVFPHVDPARIVAVSIARGGVTVALARDDAGWRVTAPAAGPAAPGAIDDVLGAFELADGEHRAASEEVTGLGAPRAIAIATDDTGGTLRLAIGADGPTGLAWADAGDGPILIEGWVAHALDRGPAELRDRAVVHVATPTGLEWHDGGVDLVAQGAPLRALVPGGGFRIAPARIAALADALAGLRFVAWPDAAAPPAIGTVRVLGGTAPDAIDDLGDCPGTAGARWVGGTSGTGCVDGAAWDALLAVVRAIAVGGAESVDPRPTVPSPVSALEQGDAHAERRGGSWTLTVAGAPVTADDSAIDDLVRGLADPGTIRAPGAPRGAPLIVRHDDGTVDSLALSGEFVRRGTEPFAIDIDAELVGVLERGLASLVDTGLLAEEPSALRTIVVRDPGRPPVTIARGATLGRWSASPGAVDLAAVAALRDLTGSLRASHLGGATPGPDARTLVLTFDPPPVNGGQDIVHTIVVDAVGRASVDGTVGQLDREALATLRAPLAH